MNEIICLLQKVDHVLDALFEDDVAVFGCVGQNDFQHLVSGCPQVVVSAVRSIGCFR